jgi:hypothetical protein
LQIAKILFRVAPFGFAHNRHISLNLLGQSLEFLLLGNNLALAWPELFFQRFHRNRALWRSLHQCGNIDDADFQFLRRSRQTARRQQSESQKCAKRYLLYKIHIKSKN